MKAQMTFQRACIWGAVVCVLLFFSGLAIAGFLPPMAPSLSAAEVAAYYREHANSVRLGAALLFLSSVFYGSFTAIISGQMHRIPSVHRTVVYAQLSGGTFACVTFLIAPMLFAATAFRPDRSPEATQLLNDLSWIMLVMPWSPFMLQYFAFAFAIFSDNRPEPLFPRWLGYFEIWVPVLFVPATVLAFFKVGPLAWNGAFAFWIPAVVFGAAFIVNIVYLSKAVSSEERELTQAVDGSHPAGVT